MHTQVMKWVSIVVLLLAAVFWHSAPAYQSELNLVVSVAAAVVLIQAFQVKKYSWAAGFFGIALLFNPVMPAFPLAGGFGFSLIVVAIAPFAISLVALRAHPQMSIPSITNRNPRSQAL